MDEPCRYLEGNGNIGKLRLKIRHIAKMQFVAHIVREDRYGNAGLYVLQEPECLYVDLIIDDVYGALCQGVQPDKGLIGSGGLTAKEEVLGFYLSCGV